MSSKGNEYLTGDCMNTLIMLFDGAVDDKIPELGYKTPLEVLEKPFIDSLASSGIYGCTDPREYTHLFLLEFLTGSNIVVPRGVIEALGLGVSLSSNQVAYRLSPAIIKDNTIKWVYRLSQEEAIRLQNAVMDYLGLLGDLNPRVYFYGGGRGVITVESSSALKLPSPPSSASIETIDLGEFENFIRKIASETGGLIVFPWGGGSLKTVEIHSRIRSEIHPIVVVSKSPSVLGVGAFLKLGKVRVFNLGERFHKAFLHLKFSNVLLHIEEIDEVSHKKSPKLKISLLKEIDKVLMENIKLMEGCKVAVIVDHGTSSITGRHLDVKVPFAASNIIDQLNPRIRFCETSENYVPLKKLVKVILGSF